MCCVWRKTLFILFSLTFSWMPRNTITIISNYYKEWRKEKSFSRWFEILCKYLKCTYVFSSIWNANACDKIAGIDVTIKLIMITSHLQAIFAWKTFQTNHLRKLKLLLPKLEWLREFSFFRTIDVIFPHFSNNDGIVKKTDKIVKLNIANSIYQTSIEYFFSTFVMQTSRV